jgi:hypothetical protein
LKSRAPLTLPSMRSTAGHSDQSNISIQSPAPQLRARSVTSRRQFRDLITNGRDQRICPGQAVAGTVGVERSRRPSQESDLALGLVALGLEPVIALVPASTWAITVAAIEIWRVAARGA